MGETRAHQRLKQIGARFLLNAGCGAVAFEVQCPFARYRIDVAGFLDTRPVASGAARQNAAGLAGTLWGATRDGMHEISHASRRERCQPRTAIIECKQDRADFRRDGDEQSELLSKRDRLEERLREIEEGSIKENEPHLRDSDAFLFGEMESWNFTSSRSGAYRRTLRELRAIEERLHGHTKFWLTARYRLADRLYVLAPAGMISPRELSSGWGLLEAPAGLIERRGFDAVETAAAVTIARGAPELGAREQLRARLLRNIAVAATRSALTVRREDAATTD